MPSTPRYSPVKVEAALLRDLKTLAQFHGRVTQVYVSELLRPVVRAAMAEMAETIRRRADEERPGGGR
jgi:hypothetical protein